MAHFGKFLNETAVDVILHGPGSHETNHSSTISFLKAQHTTSLDTRQSQSQTSYLLNISPAQNKNCICSSTYWHEIKLHLINVHLL